MVSPTLTLFLFLIWLLHVLVLIRVLLREERDPAARLAWILCILVLPMLGMVLYILFGEARIGIRRLSRLRRIEAALPRHPQGIAAADVPALLVPAFARAASVNGFQTLPGNAGTLLANSDTAIDAMIADIDAARDHVHMLFYIWLPDGNGLRLAEAVHRAAARGVTCRCLIDAVGSKAMAKHPVWTALAAAGAQTGRTFPLRWLHGGFSFGRADIRNHRKILVIDGAITYCGSQNIADPAFLPKARYAPWVDINTRLTGPVVWQNQCLFAADWQLHTGKDISSLLSIVPTVKQGGFPAVAIGTGPAEHTHATPDVVQAVMAVAQKRLAICTPYFVPDDAVFQQICAAALRGVAVDLILPARNDSRIVALASHSFYRRLLSAGVRLHEYQPGLLHSKLVMADDCVALIGSANLDRRSFDLNFENTILLADRDLCAALGTRFASYLADSRPVSLDEVRKWPIWRRVLNNTIGTMGPLL